MAEQTAYACNFKTTARRLNRVKINDLLEKADDSNEMMISSSIPKFKTDLKAPDISPTKEATGEDEYIPILKVTLESLVVEDEELKEYYQGLQSRLSQKKIDDIYNIISADIPFYHSKKTFSNATTKAFSVTKNKHLTKKDDSLSMPSFEQKTITDEYTSEQVTESTDLTPLDEKDFDSISERISRGEIKIESDDTDSPQLTLETASEVQEKEEADDLNLKIAFDMINNESIEEEFVSDEANPVENLFSRLFKYRAKVNDESQDIKSVENDEYNGFEYDSINDKDEAEKLLGDASKLALRKLILSSLVVIALGLGFGIFGKNGIFSGYLDYERYSIPFILLNIQLLFLSVWIQKGCFLEGLLSFTTGKFTSSTVFTATSIVTTLHSIFSIFNNDGNIQLYNSIPILMALFMGINTYLKCKKDIKCFEIISSEDEKYVSSELSSTSKEASNFYSYLSEDSDVYTVSKTKFVTSFFKRISKRPESESILNVIIPGVFFVSAIIFSICFFYGKMGVYSSFTASTAFISSAMPTVSVFIITLPLVAANNSCRKFDSAIIGDIAAEEYSTASVISFEDRELFPPSKVVMTDMKVYHNMRIDQIIIELAKIFSHIGGPLKELFSDAVDGVFEEHEVIRVLESAENGVMIAADGVDYYLGNGDFMRSHSLSYEDDEKDLAFERNGGSVMIFGANKVVAAKFYFRYKPQKGFKKLLSHMYKCGLCIGIKTLDPNINNNLLAYYADGSLCPISILKTSSPEEIVSYEEKVDSGIVSKRSLGAFLKAFMLCDKARHTIKSNGIVMLAGTLLTAILMIFLSTTGGIIDFTSNYAFLFQLLWSGAVLFLSFFKQG